ncbi:hypothetical protein NLI96_g9830 [Meripilus lineatus]|uniref:Uncharacterized protein n=1 Tax=Meripilus lineatus TaxID=2056292 RepID=A0AAD5YEX2_9APHY|nr:hypothetical protein NLI96_g9830 [Physisporinus lineatus]
MLHLSNITLVPASTSLKMPDKLRKRLAIKIDKPNPKKALKNLIVKKPRAAVGKIKSVLDKAKAKKNDDTHADISAGTIRASPAPSDVSGASGETTLQCSEVRDEDSTEVKVAISDDSADASPTDEVDEVVEQETPTTEGPVVLDEVVVVRPSSDGEDDGCIDCILGFPHGVGAMESEDIQENDESTESAQSDKNDSEDVPIEETEDNTANTVEDTSSKNAEVPPPPPMTEEEEERKDNLETMARIVQGALAGRRALDRDQNFLWFNVPIFKGKLFMLVQPDDVPDMVTFMPPPPRPVTPIVELSNTPAPLPPPPGPPPPPPPSIPPPPILNVQEVLSSPLPSPPTTTTSRAAPSTSTSQSNVRPPPPPSSPPIDGSVKAIADAVKAMARTNLQAELRRRQDEGHQLKKVDKGKIVDRGSGPVAGPSRSPATIRPATENPTARAAARANMTGVHNAILGGVQLRNPSERVIRHIEKKPETESWQQELVRLVANGGFRFRNAGGFTQTQAQPAAQANDDSQEEHVSPQAGDKTWVDPFRREVGSYKKFQTPLHSELIELVARKHAATGYTENNDGDIVGLRNGLPSPVAGSSGSSSHPDLGVDAREGCDDQVVEREVEAVADTNKTEESSVSSSRSSLQDTTHRHDGA